MFYKSFIKKIFMIYCSTSPQRGSYKVNLSPTLAAVALAAGAVLISLAAVGRFGPVRSVRFIGATVSGTLLMTASLVYLCWNSIQKGLIKRSPSPPQSELRPSSGSSKIELNPADNLPLEKPEEIPPTTQADHPFIVQIEALMVGANPPQKPNGKPEENRPHESFKQRADRIIEENNLSLLSLAHKNPAFQKKNHNSRMSYIHYSHAEEVLWSLLETDPRLKPYAEVLASQICYFVCAMQIKCDLSYFFLQPDGSCIIFCEKTQNVMDSLFVHPTDNDSIFKRYSRSCLYTLVPEHCHKELDNMVRSMLPNHTVLFEDKRNLFNSVLTMRSNARAEIRSFRKKQKILNHRSPITLIKNDVDDLNPRDRWLAFRLVDVLNRERQGGTLDREHVLIQLGGSEMEETLKIPPEWTSEIGSKVVEAYWLVMQHLTSKGVIMGCRGGRANSVWIHC